MIRSSTFALVVSYALIATACATDERGDGAVRDEAAGTGTPGGTHLAGGGAGAGAGADMEAADSGPLSVGGTSGQAANGGSPPVGSAELAAGEGGRAPAGGSGVESDNDPDEPLMGGGGQATGASGGRESGGSGGRESGGSGGRESGGSGGRESGGSGTLEEGGSGALEEGGTVSAGGEGLNNGGSAPLEGGSAGASGSDGVPPEVCALPFESGSCDGRLEVYTFDAATGLCEPAMWGGCGGNGNHFDTAQECYDTCAPRQCGSSARPASPGPYPIQFAIDIAMTESYYTRNVCSLPDYQIYSCSDGYTQPIVTAAVCVPECGSGGCPLCGECPEPETRPITTTVEWSGNQLVSGTSTDGCACNEIVAAPAGEYMVRVPFFDSPEGVREDEPAYECTVHFQLPDPDGVVEVVLNGGEADCVRLSP